MNTSTPRTLVSPNAAGNSPTSNSNGAVEQREDEGGWSGEEDDDDVGADGSRKRKRPMSVSCELCKQRKVKCDRGQPSCGWCLRNGQICEYRERKKPGLRAGYGKELEARLDKLEGVLSNQQHVLQQLAAHLNTGAQSIVSPSSQHEGHHTQAALFMQNPDMYPTATVIQYNRLQQQQQQVQNNETNQHHSSHQTQPQHQHHASQPSVHLPPITSAGLYTPSNPPLESPSLNISAAATQDGAMKAVSQDHDFPPYDLLYALTDLFFKHINTWCPILHRRSTLDSLFGANTLEEADRILLHSIVATTLRFSTDPRLSDQARERYHATSKQKVLLYGLENSSVKALQALVVLALDIVGSSNGPPGWNLLALITRSVVQLGLAVESTSASVAPLIPSIYTLRAMVLPEPKSFIEDESRRRLFWMVYLLDRYGTIATAFEFALDDKEIDRKLPCRDDLFARNQPVDTRWFQTTDGEEHFLSEMNHPENLGSFSYYIEIVGILSQIHRFLKKPVDISALSDVEQWQQEYRQLDSRLNAWKFSLPSEYGNMSRLFNPDGGNKVVNCIWIMLHITYHTTVIRLHSSAAYPTTRSPIFTPSFSASQRCHTAVEDICALCQYVKNNNMLTKLGPPFAFSLWVAARLLLVHGSTIDRQVNPAIQPLVETLREIGYFWNVAERYATLLQRVLDEYSESERAPVGANGVRETPSTVRILADMRRCAYDLDFLISRQPRQYFGSKQVKSVTPARTPAPNELEYLDVFDFFNMPRLPSQAAGETNGGNGVNVSGENAAPEYQTFMDQGMEYNNANDWLVQ
ncbi:hypothetical protein DOTSEDRAFT_147895 [Dothistroma septosporum NZE10]|uniref:Zn(2)-C6 fungal-type domain-containing protein n=1 Tax=Dothistroma septosporum (strain NZE10 / CBS 128990) TaxID=675120 RepID=N1PRF5_DOTSN|nr:hypothetical protein DOTSEDRAFT_147895 [Dothistroma septosporum NZE10]